MSGDEPMPGPPFGSRPGVVTGPPPAAPDQTATGRFAAELPPGSVLAGRFRVDGLLGIGGMGMVYRATDLDLDIPVAVKLLRADMADRPGAFERFRRELLLARQVSSPHVLRIHDIARHVDRWLITMDLVEGEPLDRWLDARGPLPVDQAVALARQVALGLSAAHARDVIHRDLKPSNVLIDMDGNARIGDFGIARSLGTSGLTGTGTVVGTPDYLSPEQARAQPVDGRSDLYALGLLLYEMLAGQPAFAGTTAAESLARRMVGPPPSIRTQRKDVPDWLERLLDRLLRSNPAHRLQSADAVVRAIDERSVPREAPSLRRAALAVAGAAGLAGVAGMLWFGLHRDVPDGAMLPASHLPPPARLVVLPIRNGTGAAQLDPALAGLTELLRQHLADAGPLPVVDGERVDQAVAQLGLDDNPSDADRTALRRLLPATVVLQPRLLRRASGYRLEAIVSRANAPNAVVSSPMVAGLLTAARAFEPALSSGLAAPTSPPATGQPAAATPAPAPPSTLPATEADLADYGRAVTLQHAGRMEDAAAALAPLVTRAPGFTAAVLLQAQVAVQSGRLEAAADTTARALSRPAAPRVERALRHWQALAGGESKDFLSAAQGYVSGHPDDLDARLRLAQVQGNANAPLPAIGNLRALLARDPNDPRAWFALGKFSILHGEIREAVDEYLVRALVQYKRGRNAFGEAETVNALGVAYARLGQSADAHEQFTKAVALRRALGDRRGVASSLRNLAQLATVQGDFTGARARLDEARALFAAIGDDDGLDAVDNELGVLAEERGDFVAAEEAFRRMLHAREQAHDDYGVAESQSNIGFAQFARGDYDNANAYWQQALAGFGKLGDAGGIVQVQQNLGSLGIARGDWAGARALLEASLQSATQHQMVEETAVSRFHLAELSLAEGRFGDALDHLERARRLFTERADKRGLAEAALLRGQLMLAANALPEATAALSALDPAAADAPAEQKAGTALLRAQLAQRRGDAAGARHAWELARTAAAASGMRVLVLRSAVLGRSLGLEGPGDASLENDTRDLGNIGLQLELVRARLDHDRATGQLDAAVAHYAQARALLRGHEQSPLAVELHALGADALAKAGDQVGAAAARALAVAGANRIRGVLPDAMLAAYVASLPAGLVPPTATQAVADGR